MNLPCTLYFNKETREWKLSINVDIFYKKHINNIKYVADGFYNTENKYFREFNYSNNDWILILKNHLYSYKEKNKYYYTPLLRSIFRFNLQKFKKEELENAIKEIVNKYPNAKDWLIRDIWTYATLTTYNKKAILLDIINQFGYHYENKSPKIISEAFQICKTPTDKDINDTNLLEQIGRTLNNIHNAIINQLNLCQIINSPNELIQLMMWLEDKSPMSPFDTINKYFYYFSLNIRWLIVRKLFYEHKEKHLQLTVELLDKLINSPKKILGEYQTVLIPSQTKNISLEIFIDSLKSYIQTGQFLSLNGIIDKAIQYASIINPNIDFGIHYLFNYCNGGIKINPAYIGFAYIINDNNKTYFIRNDIKINEIPQKKLDNYIEKTLNTYANLDTYEKKVAWSIPQNDNTTLHKLKSLLYIRGYKSTFIDNETEKDTKQIPINYNKICYPQFSNKRNELLDMFFLWCNKSICFKSALVYQKDWRKYKLIDFLIILDYGVTEETPCGLVPNKKYRKFIDIMLKASKITEHMKCKNCSHILIPIKQTANTNDYSYYICQNPQCSQYKKVIYLNHCYNCRYGIIDSRETHECSNGMFICPDCFSCCSNDFFQKQADKYTSYNMDIPQKLKECLGKGHADKGIQICPKCLTQFSKDESKCPNCSYQKKVSYYWKIK